MNRRAGYTLLEMVVVLAVLGMATAMVAPATFRTLQSWRDANEVGRVLADLAALPTLARNQGREIRVGAENDTPGTQPGLAATKPELETESISPVALPDGWRMDMDEPLVVRANGACSGGTGTLTTERQTIRFRVQAPFCKVTRLAADAPA